MIKKDFQSFKINQKETIKIIQTFFTNNNIILDPHTAIGLGINLNNINNKNKQIVYISTAHPSKFPDVIKKVIGKKINLPKDKKKLLNDKENFKVLNYNYNLIKNFIIEESIFYKNV